MNSEVRVRFAPSPTGYLHVGGARTALFNYLFARNMGGKFILRIEDTDQQRSTDESTNAILRSMKWLGLEWDEGPEVGGNCGPYYQTQRMDIYNDYAKKLLESGHAYYCFCSQEELDSERQEMEKNGVPPKYSGKCRNISLADAQKRIAAGEKAAIRFKMPGKEIKFNDLVRGELTFDGNLLGDMVIVRSDGFPTYNYAVVIDDGLMKMTHVLRGDDHISNTPKQIVIYEALGFTQPVFGHISMILGPDGSRLSKRHGATSVEEYKKAGILPEALDNFLALLGWSPEGDREFFTKEELIKEFSMSRVAKSPAVFDVKKLTWMNGNYIRKNDDEAVAKMTLPYLIEAGLVKESEVEEKMPWLVKVMKTAKTSFETLADAPKNVTLFFNEDYEVKKDDAEVAKYTENKELTNKVLDFVVGEITALENYDLASVKAVIKKAQKTLGVTGHDVFMPLRVSLTGLSSGPGVYEMFDILGRERVMVRLKNFKEKYLS
ncbi:MAG: glutamate--tRNA ligase [Candidatus Wallbacteria bacterium]